MSTPGRVPTSVTMALREEVRNMFGWKGALLENTIIIFANQRRELDDIIDECAQLTHLYISRQQAPAVRARLEAIVKPYRSEDHQS